MLLESCGSSFIVALPDDIFAIISRSLLPRDICNLSVCCKSLCSLVTSEKIWFSQCQRIGIVSDADLVEWRKGVLSYKALCRFLLNVKPLIGIWVHQNPELGNVVYVMPGFVSVVGCRIIPQELGLLGIEEGPILWAPVFEIIGDLDGSGVFLLHGREGGFDCFCPGLVKAIERNCNVLLLEVEPMQQNHQSRLLHGKSFVNYSEEISKNIGRSSNGLSKSGTVLEQTESMGLLFSQLGFSDRRRLLELITSQVCLKVPDSINGPLFPHLRDDTENAHKDMVLLLERRSLLLETYKLGDNPINLKDPVQLDMTEIQKSLEHTSVSSSLYGDRSQTENTKTRTFRGYFRESFKHILGRSSSFNSRSGVSKDSSSRRENRHAQLREFLNSGNSIGLVFHASTMKLTSYRAWPNMHDSRFALYKLPIQAPKLDHEYAGLWGGTFGWPPGGPTEDKPGKALFFLLLSYEESQGQRLLIATKILEGTHYVLHPNGSAMFIVNIDKPSLDPFPWNTDSDSDTHSLSVKHAFVGEGIASGYGFRYPGSKPGSLYVTQCGLLAFSWKESRAVLTLQRINMEQLLKKGERVPPLSPVANFSYLTKSYSNVFAGFPNASTCLSSPRQNHI